MSLNALRESVYHLFYAESGYSYNARYLDQLSLFWEWQRQLCAHFLCIPQNMPFWLNGFAGAEEMQTTTSNKAHGKDLCIHRSICSKKVLKRNGD